MIIHGKGTKNQSNKAPIKKLVEKIIVSSPNVLAANSAIRSNGGRGATVLLIKNWSCYKYSDNLLVSINSKHWEASESNSMLP